MKKTIFNVVSSEIKGRHLIEASAGTGKTYSLIHIVLRLIVEEQIPRTPRPSSGFAFAAF